MSSGSCNDMAGGSNQCSGTSNTRATSAVENLRLNTNHKKSEAPASPASWPFPDIPEDEVRALALSQLSALQGALALAIAQLKLGIEVVARPATTTQPPGSPGALADISGVDDPFPMYVTPPAPPWAGGETTFQAERARRARISSTADVVANVEPGMRTRPTTSSNLFWNWRRPDWLRARESRITRRWRLA